MISLLCVLVEELSYMIRSSKEPGIKVFVRQPEVSMLWDVPPPDNPSQLKGIELWPAGWEDENKPAQ